MFESPPQVACERTIESMMQRVLENRNRALRRVSQPLPGSRPYDNLRPINIPGRFDGCELFESVCEMYPQVKPQQWREWFERGHILRDHQPVEAERAVRAGEQFWHCFPATIEPEVDARIRVIWEDEWFVGIVKPAPLPCHPCGRFNRNTLSCLLEAVYGRREVRLVHRLDANTTGVMVLARSQATATLIRNQFELGTPGKRYLVRLQGRPRADQFVCDAAISKQRFAAGIRSVSSRGLPATTEFYVLDRFDDGTTIAEARPRTGRTNQIRIHLWSMGMPVVGDPTYLPEYKVAPKQTLTTLSPPMCLHASSLTLDHPRKRERFTLADDSPPWAK